MEASVTEVEDQSPPSEEEAQPPEAAEPESEEAARPDLSTPEGRKAAYEAQKSRLHAWADDSPERHDDDEPDEDRTPPAPAKPADQAEPSDEEEESEEPTDAALPYELVGADGAELRIPEGAKLRFKADGGQTEVASVAELVELASKGVNYDRRIREVAGREATAEQATNELARVRQAHRQELETLDEQFRRIVMDDDRLDEFRAELRKHEARMADPETRAAFEAKAKLERDEATAEESLLAEVQDAQRSKWGEVRDSIGSLLEQPDETFRYLTAEDAEEVVGLLFEDYRATVEQTYNQLLAKREAGGQSFTDEDARIAAQYAGLSTLDEARIREALGAVNTRIAKLGERFRTDAERRNAEGRRDAESHDRYMDGKDQSRKRSRTVRSSGSAEVPSGSGGDGLDDLMRGSRSAKEKTGAMRALIQRLGS